MQNLSKSKISLFKSLSINKFRNEHNLFIAEGHKIIAEVLKSSLNIKYIIHTNKWGVNLKDTSFEIIETTESDIKKISNLKTPPSVIAIIEIPKSKLKPELLKNKLTLAIDDIQDPGNLGTIIRICDWFGIENVICSGNSVDIYNPKVIQATMGAFLRVNAFYVELDKFITDYKAKTSNICYGTFLEGENIYKTQINPEGLIVLGNEGQGISQTVEMLIDKKIVIPPYKNDEIHAQSLNISIAAAIICSEFRKR
jgi:TrmH family RNA methyltransferase